MIQTRWSLAASSWNKAFNKHPEIAPHSDNSLITPLQVHCRIPVCIDYKEELPEHVLEAIVNDVKEKGFNYTIYLCPRNESAYVQWQSKNARVLKRIPAERIILFSTWRQTEAWQKAEKIYNQFFQSELKYEFEKYLEIDKTKWSKKYPHTSLEESEDHIICAVKDILSWTAIQTGNAMPEKKSYLINLLLYAHDLSKSMQIAMKYANKMGFIRDSFVHVKYEIEVTTVESFVSNLLTQISVKLGAHKVDAKWSADFVAQLYDKLGSPSTLLSSPRNLAHDANEQEIIELFCGNKLI